MAEQPCSLDDVIATGELDSRASRRPEPDAESRALLALTRALAESPHTFFDQLVKTALELARADSTGISLLSEERGRFVWPAVAGRLDSFLGGGTPSDFGPCGTVLDRNQSLLFIHPQKYFDYLQSLEPSLEEVLLIPFHLDGRAVGTIWAVSHDKNRKFDAEDRRVLENLSAFAASAYRVLANLGELEPMLRLTPETARRNPGN